MVFSFFRGRTSAPKVRDPWELSAPLLHWSERDPWTIGDAVTGTLVTGATGSGKTSGSGRAMAMAMLRAGFGGLVLTAKPDEVGLWRRYAKDAGREGDLLVFGADASLRFNFLHDEATRRGEGAGLTDNVLNLFSTIIEVAERGSGGGGQGREDEGYFRRASRQLLRNAIDLILIAREPLTVSALYRVIISAPTAPAQVRSTEWQSKSLCFQLFARADRQSKSQREAADLAVAADYFLVEFAELSEKTRGAVVSTVSSMADVLMRGQMRELFSADTNLTPEVIAAGSILVIDLPVKTFAEAGVFAQVLWKYAFQRAIERRDLSVNGRPVFLWADEAQNFITSHDMQFQTTCRSARVATVYLTQNVSNVYAALGGTTKGTHEAASLFANLNTKIFHANGDTVTNHWAAETIGQSRQFLANGSTSRQGPQGWQPNLGFAPQEGSTSASAGFSESWQYEVHPSAYTQLRTGGPANGRRVEGIVFQNGRRFRASDKSWMRVTFRQEG